MTMVISNKLRIHYRFEGDKGAYLLLHHGLFGSQRDWYDAGYVDTLRDEFRIIVVDARGHGRSDRPLDPSQYRLAAYADDVVSIMDELDIRNLHFLGYSLGALVGFELLMRYPERMRIVMLAGESPFVSEGLLDTWKSLSGAILAEGLRPLQERLRQEQRLVISDLPPEAEGEQSAALAMMEGLAAEVPRADENRLSVNSPVALFCGEDDAALNRVRDARRRIHRARFVSFPGQSHGGLFRQRESLVAEMLRLLRPGRRGEEGSESGARERDSHQGGGRQESAPDRDEANAAPGQQAEPVQPEQLDAPPETPSGPASEAAESQESAGQTPEASAEGGAMPPTEPDVAPDYVDETDEESQPQPDDDGSRRD